MAEKNKKHTIVGVHITPPLHEQAQITWSSLSVSVFTAVPNIWKTLRFWYELTTSSFLLSEQSWEQNGLF